MSKGVVVNLAPIALHEGRHEQQQSALGLMEVGDDTSHDVECVARRNHDLRIGVQGWQFVTVEIGEDVLQCLQGGKAVVVLLIGHPLGNAQLLLRSIGAATDEYSYII